MLDVKKGLKREPKTPDIQRFCNLEKIAGRLQVAQTLYAERSQGQFATGLSSRDR